LDIILQDVAAIKKGRQLMESGVEALSYFGDSIDIFYFMGLVSAAMKKSVSYNIKLVVNKKGEILNSHCDCPAGFGPHGTCKHITATLLVLSCFVTKGELKILKSCTETLQTFQKPKKLHHGSPVKADEIGKKLPKLDDPRPKRFRNLPNFQDEVRNRTVNFVYQSGLDISMRYTFSKANLSLAALDHDYLQKPFTEY